MAKKARVQLFSRLINREPDVLVAPMEDGPVVVDVEMIIYDVIGMVRRPTIP